ncbi:MAG: arabinose isomerase [Spirochaetes bacterium]|jgi:L-arabinose isomerase|nr:arabinose isomerase [Spirochaetota bacterium]
MNNESVSVGVGVRVGLFGIGLDTYWPQFTGLKERLEGYLGRIHQKLEDFGAEVMDHGLVDSPEKSLHVGDSFKEQNVDVVFLFVSTYALSSTVLPVVQRAACPVVVLNIQPVSRIDYQGFNALEDRGVMTGEWLAHCQACCVPEIASVFKRAGIPYHLVTGYLQEEETWQQVREWVEAGRVRRIMQNNRLGVMGHYYDGMLDVYTDMTRQVATFGGRIDLVEIDELKALRDGVTDGEVAAKREEFSKEFKVAPECEEAELDRAARTSVALDKLVAAHGLGSLSYYYEGVSGNEHENIITSVIAGNSLLTAHHVPVAGENEIKNAQAMKIMDSFGAGGSFTEYYALDFDDDIVMMGHDGPGHIAIAEGKTKVRPLEVYHGKVGRGLSVEMSVKHGPVTLLSVVQTRDGRVKLLTAEAESVPGPILHIGNTNSRYRFSIRARDFVEAWNAHGPAHHCAVGVGHLADKIEKLGELLHLETVRVC